MKPILIALMIVVGVGSVEAQKSRAEKKVELQEASKRATGFEATFTNEFQFDVGERDVIADWFIKNWEEYKRECWNDSGLVTYHQLPSDAVLYDVNPCSNPTHWRTEWIHARGYIDYPPLLIYPDRVAKESFIDYLKQKK